MIEVTPDGQIIAIISVAMASMSTLVRSVTIDKEKLKVQKEKIKEYQAKLKEAQKKKDMKSMQHTQSKMSAVMMEQMKHSFKPLLVTMIPFLIVFRWLGSSYGEAGLVVQFPFILPLLGDGLGWLGWYITCSMIVSIALNKILKLS
ncbi:EMC3/TMCO1 family protein [Candidatus Altiarchaeota archaeon]